MPAHLRIRSPKTKQGRLAQLLMHRAWVRKKYTGAWVLMDRLHDAADSGEILFRYLREHRPEINAWFVLEKGGKRVGPVAQRGTATGWSRTARCSGGC